MRRLRTKTRVADSLAPCEACPAPRPRQRSQPGAPSIKPRRTNKSARAAASCSGLLPKARKGFALFTQARWRDESLPSANADKFRVLGQEWKSLPEEDKRQWHENSKREFEAQRRAALLSGIRVRYDKGAKPMAVEPSPTAQSSVLMGKYDCGVALGEGSYGLVLRARDVETGRFDALKVFKQGSDRDEIHHELQMYLQIESCASAKASRFFLSPVGFSADSPMPWIAFPYGGLSLRDCLQRGRLDDVAAMACTAQLVVAVGHLRRMYICHFDIKASNVLWSLDDSALKLVDMGMAERIPVKNPRFEVYVSEPYRPPEVWAAASVHMMVVALAPAVDVWSVGCLVFEVVSGKCLMEAINRKSIRTAVQIWCAAHSHADQQRLVSVQLARVHATWQRFVACCCAPVPESRLRFAGVTQGLTWLRDLLAAHANRDPFRITAPSSNQQALPRHR